MVWRRLSFVLAITFALGGLAAAQPPGGQDDAKKKADEARKAREAVHEELIGKPAADITAVFSLNGKNQKLSDLKGKVVLLDFWAVWCGPCIATFPHLTEWNTRYKGKGLEIVGLTSYQKMFDFKGGKLAKTEKPLTEKQEQAMLKAFAAHHKLKHRLAVLSDEAKKGAYGAYKVSGIPQMVLIDREGVVRMVKVGSGEANAKAIEAEIKKLLANVDSANE